MRVLITNNALASRAGTELYVRDLALGLLARGHAPVAFSRTLGDVARELRARTVPVIDDLDRLGQPPDVIHGHHHFETMQAVLRFPDVPAISYCHGWLPWEEAPVRFPSVRHWVAVDETCRDRLVSEHGIPAGRVRLLLNFVDLARFRARVEPLPARPRRALVFSNAARETTHLAAVRAACAGAGVELDVMGLGSGTASDRPEEALPRYDLVFAKARAALEAMAAGAAVVLCDAVGAGPLVTAAGFDRLRPLNFGIRALREPVGADALAREVARYDPADAAAVSRRVRAEAGIDAIVEATLALYREAIEEHRREHRRDPDAEARAAAAYLRSIWPEADARHRAIVELGAERDALRAERDALLEERAAAAGAELAARFASLPRSLLRFEGGPGPGTDLVDLVAAPAPGADGATLSARSGDPQVTLPPLDIPDGARLILRAEITAPADTVAALYFATAAEPGYSERQSVSAPLKKGRGSVLLELPPGVAVAGRLRFDPGAVAGEYGLHALEVRC